MRSVNVASISLKDETFTLLRLFPLNASREKLRNIGTIEGKMWKGEERKEEVPAPITLPPLDAALQFQLYQRYEKARDAETRTRYHMMMLAQSGHPTPHIARLVLRSEDTIERVLNRFLTGGLDAVPQRNTPGRARTVTSARARRVGTRDRTGSRTPVGQDTANWTTGGSLTT
jgi:hypothetical protein